MNTFREINLKEVFSTIIEAQDNMRDVLTREFYSAIYPGKGYDDYLKDNEGDLRKIITDAKKSNDFAECYLILKSKERVFGVFWNNFLGKASSNVIKKRRINNGDFNEFIGLIFIAFDKAIKSFDLKKYKNLTLGNWQYWFGQYLKREAISENTRNMNAGPANTIHPDTVGDEDDSAGGYWDKIASHDDTLFDGDFEKNWKEFCSSPEMNSKFSAKIDKKRKEILADVLKGDRTVNMIASDYGVAGNTIRSAINVGDLLRRYDITQEDLGKYLHDDPDFILGSLNENVA